MRSTSALRSRAYVRFNMLAGRNACKALHPALGLEAVTPPGQEQGGGVLASLHPAGLHACARAQLHRRLRAPACLPAHRCMQEAPRSVHALSPLTRLLGRLSLCIQAGMQTQEHTHTLVTRPVRSWQGSTPSQPNTRVCHSLHKATCKGCRSRIRGCPRVFPIAPPVALPIPWRHWAICPQH